jgi:hypothetical protein
MAPAKAKRAYRSAPVGGRVEVGAADMLDFVEDLKKIKTLSNILKKHVKMTYQRS